MQTREVWSEQHGSHSGVTSPVWAVAFRNDGALVACAVGARLHLYDAQDGRHLQTLKGHKGTVFCLSWSSVGGKPRLASGGADSAVIIWGRKAGDHKKGHDTSLETFGGVRRYTHSDPVHCVLYNHVTGILASGACTDLGLWDPESSAVNRKPTTDKVLCLSWSRNGQFLALGLFNGQISIRVKDGSERVKIERNAPIWSLAWNPGRDEVVDILAVVDWDQTLSFYQLAGKTVKPDRELGFDPCSIQYLDNGQYLLIAGADRSVTLWSGGGVKLGLLSGPPKHEDWIWGISPAPTVANATKGSTGGTKLTIDSAANGLTYAAACNDGTISCHDVTFSTVHAFYNDKYARREFMTEVVVQDLVTEKRARINCREYVKKISVYNDKVAVQLPRHIAIFEQSTKTGNSGTVAQGGTMRGGSAGVGGTGKPNELSYQLKHEIPREGECLLLITAQLHFVICLEKKLELYEMKSGQKKREWVVDSSIRYVRCAGGPPGSEGLLVGLKSGLILKIFLDNPFPVNIVKHDKAVICLDQSFSRKKIAVVDDDNNCVVYDTDTKKVIFQETDAKTVAFNTDLDDMLCFTGGGMLHIKAGNFPAHKQKLLGYVVGFKGSRIFCMYAHSMTPVDVPQTASLYKYLDRGDFHRAWEIACLGVTDHDWRVLGYEALQQLNLDVARKAFIRVRDLHYLELIEQIEVAKRKPKFNAQLFLGDILAYQGKFDAAAKCYAGANQVIRAVEMFCDLRDWENARLWASSTDAVELKDLIRLQAQWAEASGDWEAAVEMYVACGDFQKAAQIYGDHERWEDLIDLCRTVRKGAQGTTETLETAVEYFKDAKQDAFTLEVLLKMDALEELLQMYVEMHKWDEAMALLHANQSLDKARFYLPYAHWLALNDRFEEAQVAFRLAGFPDEATHVLEQLTHNAVTENRFDDAAYYFWLLSKEYFNSIRKSEESGQQSPEEKALGEKAFDLRRLCAIYYAYNYVFRWSLDPFTTLHGDQLFHLARFLVNEIATAPDRNETANGAPAGIQRLHVLFALAKHSAEQDAYKVARYAYDKLQLLRLPPAWIDQVDIESINVRTRPNEDAVDVLPVCHRCGATNQLVTHKGNRCTNCNHEFVYSFYTFEILPLVRFFPERGISDEEAIRLVMKDPPKAHLRGWRGDKSQGVSMNQKSAFDTDPFGTLLDELEQQGHNEDVMVSEEILLSMRKTDVFILQWGKTKGRRAHFYRSMDADTPVINCPSCNYFFHEEDFEIASLSRGRRCPVCRAASDSTLGTERNAATDNLLGEDAVQGPEAQVAKTSK